MNISTFSRDIYPALSESIFNEWARNPPVYPLVMNVKPTTRAYEELQTKVGFGLFTQIGDQQNYPQDEIKPGFYTRVNLLKFAKHFRVSEMLVDFGKYEGLSEYTEDMGSKASLTMETFAHGEINNAFTKIQSDGVPLASVAHPGYVGSTTTFSNRLTVLASLSYTSLNAALTAMSTQVDENGLLIFMRPRKLVVHPSNLLVANEITKSSTRPDTTNRSDNELKNMLTGLQVISDPYLTSPTFWYLLADKHHMNTYMHGGLKTRPERDPFSGDFLVFGQFYQSTGVASPLGVFFGSN